MKLQDLIEAPQIVSHNQSKFTDFEEEKQNKKFIQKLGLAKGRFNKAGKIPQYKKWMVVKEIDNYHKLYRSLEGIRGTFVVKDEVSNTIEAYHKVKPFDKSRLLRIENAVETFKSWRKETGSPNLKGIISDIIFDYIIPDYHCVATHMEHTEANRALWWRYIIPRSITEQHLYAGDLSSPRYLIKIDSQKDLKSKLYDEMWGKKPRFKSKRFIISDKPLKEFKERG
jgi:hypothetical protein